MIIDAHTHLFGRWLNLRGIRPRDFVRIMDETGIDKACVFTLEGFFDARDANDKLAALIKGFESRLFPFATVDPNMGDFAVKDLRRSVRKLGMRGLKIHPWLQAFSLTNAYFLKVVEEAVRLGIPIITHNGSPPYACPTQVGNLAKKFPEATLILAEAGLKDLWLDAVAVGKKYPERLPLSGRLAVLRGPRDGPERSDRKARLRHRPRVLPKGGGPARDREDQPPAAHSGGPREGLQRQYLPAGGLRKLKGLARVYVQYVKKGAGPVMARPCASSRLTRQRLLAHSRGRGVPVAPGAQGLAPCHPFYSITDNAEN